MEMDIITEGCYNEISKDEFGRGLRIDVYKMGGGTYRAFTSYLHDKKELITGFGESEMIRKLLRFQKSI